MTVAGTAICRNLLSRTHLTKVQTAQDEVIAMTKARPDEEQSVSRTDHGERRGQQPPECLRANVSRSRSGSCVAVESLQEGFVLVRPPRGSLSLSWRAKL